MRKSEFLPRAKYLHEFIGEVMTKKQRTYIKQQRQKIVAKESNEALSRYAALLSASDILDEIKKVLLQSVDAQYVKLNPLSPLAVSADFSDDFE